MEKDRRYIRRTFFPHEYEKEEAFLSKLGREGWHFVALHKGIPTKYEFEKGEPVDYIYQLDYVTTEEDTDDYHQLFKDAGWEEMYTWDGLYEAKWYYFRKVRSNDKDERIFTDTESKYYLYHKMAIRYALYVSMVCCLEASVFTMLLRQISEASFPSWNGFGLLILLSFFLYTVIFLLYLLTGLLIKRNQLKRMTNKLL